MKKVFVKLENYDNLIVTSCLEAGVDGFISSGDVCNTISKLAKTTLLNQDDEKNVTFVTIYNHCDENEVCQKLIYSNVVLQCDNWTIIPIENVLAKRNSSNLLLASVSNQEQADVVLSILEKGVDGVVISGENDSCLEIIKHTKSDCGKIQLSIGKIVDITSVGLGDRVCIDTISNMVDGEGMLVGDFSNAMVLVNSESVDNEYVASRPFRVNAGAVHCYVVSTGGKTSYLSELRSGDNVLLVNQDGQTRVSSVGRIKCERRPMLRVSVNCDQRNFSVILQNAETIRLVTPQGSKSIVELKNGDDILVYLADGGRHFGYQIKETIDEH